MANERRLLRSGEFIGFVCRYLGIPGENVSNVSVDAGAGPDILKIKVEFVVVDDYITFWDKASRSPLPEDDDSPSGQGKPSPDDTKDE